MVSKLHQEDPKKDFRCPNKLKKVKRWPQIRAHELQGVPRWVQGRPKWTQDGSKRPQENHMLDQTGTRKEQSACHMATQIENMVLTKVLKSFEVLPKKIDQEGPNGVHAVSLES